MCKNSYVSYIFDIKLHVWHKRGRPRDIIVRFVRFPDREQIWAARNKLKNTDIIMKEDFPQEIDQRRAKLFPIQKAARAENKKAYMVVDKLFIDGRKSQLII